MSGEFGADKFSEDSRERLEPFFSVDLGVLADAIGLMYEQVQEIVVDGDQPGWTVPVTLDRAKALGWLGQFLGVRLQPFLTDSERRTAIGEVEGFARGTVSAIRAAAARTLTGNKTVNLNERVGGNAYYLSVISYTGETPDPAATEAAIRALKPAGIVLGYQVLDGQTYVDLEGDYTDYADVKSTFADYAAIRDYDAP